MGHCDYLHLLRVTFALSSLSYLLWASSWVMVVVVVVVDTERQRGSKCSCVMCARVVLLLSQLLLERELD